MNAARFALPPLPQPTYSFAEIPRASYPNLQGSTIEYVTKREDFQRCMAEMLLVCKEAVRRQRAKHKDQSKDHGCDGSKPLSLEYLADRLDVDEPIFGYLIRNEGRLQGFITVTTFTNYQQSFRWDSLNESAFVHDDDEFKQLRLSGVRKTDQDGSLARKLQATVRCGDIWQEGVVWPRVAEISLLGGLGCGRLLLELVLEDLERMKATNTCNYDFVALQATHNSITFYESLGFVRVGAVTQEKDTLNPEGKESSPTDQTISPIQKGETPMDERSSDKSNIESKTQLAEESSFLALPQNFVTSRVTTYEVKKAGEQLQAIAKKFKVDVFDILFLNQMNYPDMVPGSRLIKGTLLRIPDPSSESIRSTRGSSSVGADELKWYTAKENDTPRSLARKFNVSCVKLVQANKNRLKGLLSNSRLKQGTQVRISHLDAQDVHFVPYAHWAFPDDDNFEEGEPSYMMALQLNRKKGAKAKERPIREGLACDINEYQMPQLVQYVNTLEGGERWSIPKKPSRNKDSSSHGYKLFSAELKEKKKDEFVGKSDADIVESILQAWNNSSLEIKSWYVEKSARLRAELDLPDPESHNDDTSSEEEIQHARARITPGQVDSKENLFNVVVKVKSGSVADTTDVDIKEFKYYYVLTFIPDLRWCHLAPMIQDGFFGKDKPKFEGRPRWKLVDESLGKELDTSSSLCVPCKSKAVRRTVDADKEEWDIQDDGKPFVARRTSFTSDISVTSRQTSVSSTEEEPRRKSLNSGKKGNKANVVVARYPGVDHDVIVKLTGKAATQGKQKRASNLKKRKRTDNSDDEWTDASATSSDRGSDKEQHVPSSSSASTSTASSRIPSASVAKRRGAEQQQNATTQSTIFTRLENSRPSARNVMAIDMSCCV